MTLRLLSYPFHPFLLALYFPIFLLSNNMGLFDVQDAHRTIGVGMGVVLLAFVVCRLVYRDAHRAALVTTSVLGLCFSFSFLKDGLLWGVSGFVTLCVLTGAGLVVAMLAFTMPAGSSGSSLVLNASVAAMLVIPTYEVARARYTSATWGSHTASVIAATAQEMLADVHVPDTPPNIFHIILDGYSRNDVLQEVYGYDNSSFSNDLRELGFFVADRVTTPYGRTLQTVNSILSMNYLNGYIQSFASDYPSPSADDVRSALKRLSYRPPVLRSFAEMGYQLVVVDTDYSALNMLSADNFLMGESSALRLTSYEQALLATTPIPAVLRRLPIWFPREHDPNVKLRFALDHHDYGGIEEPMFVLSHILSPHPPFTIDRDGKPMDDPESDLSDGNHWIRGDSQRRRMYRDGYLEKLRFTNRALVEQLRRLIASVSGPKVIIIHGDHGGGMFLDQDDRLATCLKERFSPFFAVYSTDPQFTDALADDLNLVNLYRVLFNTVFGTDLRLLRSRSFYTPWKDPTDLQEVTREDLSSFGLSCGDPARTGP